METLKLVIGNKNYSSWSLRPWLALKQANIDFEEIRIPLYQPDSVAQIRRYSPAGKVPVLLHGAVTVWDSLAIGEYLAECFPERQWFPSERSTRAVARSVCAEMHSGFQALRTHMPMNCRASFPGHGHTPEVEQDIERILTLWQDCRQQHGGDGSFLFGPFTLADAMFAPVVLRFKTYAVALGKVGQEYMEAILALPALQDWLAAAATETEYLPQYETQYEATEE
jgi:glutathione S-transferase